MELAKTYYKACVGQFWDHVGTILGQFWDNFGTVLGQFWDNLGSILEVQGHRGSWTGNAESGPATSGRLPGSPGAGFRKLPRIPTVDDTNPAGHHTDDITIAARDFGRFGYKKSCRVSIIHSKKAIPGPKKVFEVISLGSFSRFWANTLHTFELQVGHSQVRYAVSR